MFRNLALLCALTLSPLASAQQFDLILDANFDNKTLGQPIGTGGAAAGEPTSWDPARIATEIVAAAPGRALRLRRLETPGAEAASSMRFQFLDNQEVTSGGVRISLILTPEQLGAYAVRTREANSSATRWIDVEFGADGNIRRQIRTEAAAVIGSYSAGVPVSLVIEGDFTERSYRILINNAAVDNGSFATAARGVGSILISFLSGSANFNRSMVIDELRVEVPSERIFQDRFQ